MNMLILLFIGNWLLLDCQIIFLGVDLNTKRIAIYKNLEKLKEQTESNNYVNRFAVIKELHRKN